MQTYSPRCVALVEHYEGLELEAYPDPRSPLGQACAKLGFPMREYRQVEGNEELDGSPWSIGWGWAHGVQRGDTCTRDQAEGWRNSALAAACSDVLEATRATLNQDQLDALTSLVYNTGEIPPTLFSMLDHGLYGGAADQFPRWNHSKGIVEPGLTARRAAERLLFKGLIPPGPIPPGFSWPTA